MKMIIGLLGPIDASCKFDVYDFLLQNFEGFFKMSDLRLKVLLFCFLIFLGHLSKLILIEVLFFKYWSLETLRRNEKCSSLPGLDLVCLLALMYMI